MKKEKKIRLDHQRMVNSYLHHLVIDSIRKVHHCSRTNAMLGYTKFAMLHTPIERQQHKEKFFASINTISKLEKELKYYSKIAS